MDKVLRDYGLVPFFAQQTSADERAQGRVGRVTAVQRSLVTVTDGSDERSIPVTSSRQEVSPEDRPTVGDWVVLDADRSRVERVLRRKGVFRRVAAGRKTEIQLLAANIDILFVVTSCNEEFSESRLERYLTMAAEAGAIAVVVLTKADLSDEVASYAARARSVQPDVPVEAVNALDKNTLHGLTAWIEPASTIALVGSSGVGKSTLLNTLAGAELAATKGVREGDKKGRHATTYRALHRLPGGGLLIDVPGLRELKVAAKTVSLANVFDEILAKAPECRFSDCGHEHEPGCAVRNAVENGEIDARRWRNYLKLRRENERNRASLAQKHSQDRAFSKHVRQVKALKQGQRNSA